MRKVHELRARGVTILFVSHAVADVKAIGDRALWLDHGRMVEIGETDRVVAKYLAAMVEKDSAYLMLKRRAGTRRAGGPRCARRRWSRPSPISITATATAARRCSASRCWTSRANRCICCEPSQRIMVRISVRAREDVAHADRGLHDAQPTGHGFLGHQHRPRRLRPAAPCRPGDIYHGGFSPGYAGALSGVVFLFAGHRRRHADWATRCAIGSTTPSRCRWAAPKARSTDSCACRAAWK